MRRPLLMLTLTVGIAAVFLSGAQQPRYSYSEDLVLLFSQECGDCHDWHTGYSRLVGPTSVYSPTTGLPIVNPSRPDSSVLVWRLEGKLPSGGNIGQMPQSAGALPAEKIKMVRDWISQGPLDLPVGVHERSWGGVKELFR